jgi:transposase
MLVDTSDKLLRERGARMTTKTHRELTEEFEREAVDLLESSGRPLMQVAKELGIQPSMPCNWRERLGSAAGRATGSERSVTTTLAVSADQAVQDGFEVTLLYWPHVSRKLQAVASCFYPLDAYLDDLALR